MKNVEVCNRTVIIADPDTCLEKAAKLKRAQAVGAIKQRV